MKSIRSRSFNRKGFALVVTLSLMILLTIIAVGMLGLSAISLRSANQGEAMATAKANARLALMLALGDLQTTAGPDKRITASGAIMDQPTESKAAITGVWESNRIDPANPPSATDYQKSGGKQRKFRKWLVSSADPEAVEQQDFVSSGSFAEKSRTTLVPALQSSGKKISEVFGGLVPVNPGKNGSKGNYAYVVLDEGVKARLDTGHRPVTSARQGDLAATMGTGLRADVARIPNLEKIDWDASDLSKENNLLHKSVSFHTGGLLVSALGGQKGENYKSLFHDVTTSSLGLFTDVANGGLKQDLNSILNSDRLPSDFTGTSNAKAYTTHLGFSTPANAVTGQVEPSWEQIYRFANLHKNTLTNKNGPTLAMQPYTGWVTPAQPPPGNSKTPTLMPTLLKMQMFYSLIAVPMWKTGSHEGDPNSMPPEKNWTEPEGGHVKWQRTAWGMGARYFMVLCMTPCVTLHNPYNTNLEVRDLSVEMSNVPMSIQLNRKTGSGQSGWLPREGQGVDMVDSVVRATTGRRFLFDLTGDAGSTIFTLAPGEVRVFTATAPPEANYLSNPYRSWNGFTDPANAKPMTLTKGFRGVTIGYYAPRITTNEMTGYETYPDGPNARGSLEYLAPNDQVKIRIRPCFDKRITSSPAEKGKCKVSLIKSGNTTSTPVVYEVVNISAGADPVSGNLLTGLEKALNLDANGQELDWVSTRNMAGTNGEQALNDMKAFTFSIMTFSAKTTHGDYLGKNLEGIMAAKPMAFHSPVTPYSVADAAKTGLEPSPYEASVIPLNSANGTGYENYLEVNALGRSYAFSGLTSQKGQQFASFYEIPLGPLQNFAQLNSANLAATHSLARFTYPIGNSWAHPMINPVGITGNNAPGTYDHSFLLNSLLFDRYFFSGIATRGGAFNSSLSSETLAQSLYGTEEDNHLLDRRLLGYLPDGETKADAIATLSTASETDATKPQARFGAASHQLMKGAFNVNSTSKSAWKAMLAALHAPDAKTFRIEEGMATASFANLKAADKNSTRYSRFTVPNNDAATTSDSPARVFQGPRDITDSELDSLAEAIVKEVKTRGPFLSMAEFVNRQLGDSDLALKGALQAAIDATSINSDSSLLADTGYQTSISTSKYVNPRAMEGRTDQGAPGYLSQSDILTVLGNAATVRSDTFTIRAYGDARDASGNVVAKAWCEAVVQRIPDYLSSEDRATTATADLKSKANQIFGRRFTIQSFRWMSPSEILPKA